MGTLRRAVPAITVMGLVSAAALAGAGGRAVAMPGGSGSGRPAAMTPGDIYTTAGTGAFGFSGDGGLATKAKLFLPSGVAADAARNVLIADTNNNRVRVVAESSKTFYGQAMTTGHIYTIAGNGTRGFSGDGGVATKAEVDMPFGVAVGTAGNVLIADTFNNRVRVVAESSRTFYGRAMTTGHIYTVAGGGTGGLGDGGLGTAAKLDYPSGVAADAAGNLLIADQNHNRVRVVAGRTGTFYGQAMTAGHIYTIAGDGTKGFSGDGGPATKAEVSDPSDVTVDTVGNVVISAIGNERVRVVAAKTGTFYGQSMTAGDIYTIAGNGTQGFSGDGGPGPQAELELPSAVAVDAAGNALIADTNNNRIRVVAAMTGTFYGQSMTAGDIYTIAGDANQGFSGDGGPATEAELFLPLSVAVDTAGNVLIADTENERVRMVAG